MGSVGYRHMMNARALGVSDISVFSTGMGTPKRPVPAGVRMETDLCAALYSGMKAAVIANPTSLHVEAALVLAKAGCHMLIEKPLSHSLANVEDLQKEVQTRDLITLLGYQFRFHPSLRLVRQWLQEKAIGDIVSASAVWGEYLPAWQPWRDYRTSYSACASLGGGAVLTLSHPIDYLRWLLGEVIWVSAATARLSGLQLDVEDAALIHFGFADGAIASVALDYVQRPPAHNLTIVGRYGVIRWDNASGVATLDTIERRTVVPAPDPFERNDMFIAEMEHFFDCIGKDDEPICSLKDGERTLRVCLAAKESARTGRRIDV
jgi:predicted dehydrogenase